jgi:hypothetical protein
MFMPAIIPRFDSLAPNGKPLPRRRRAKPPRNPSALVRHDPGGPTLSSELGAAMAPARRLPGLNTYLNASDFNRVARAFWMNFSGLLYIRCHETCRPVRIATNVTILCAGLDCCFVRKAEVMPLCTTVALMPNGKCHAVHLSRSPGIRHGNRAH